MNKKILPIIILTIVIAFCGSCSKAYSKKTKSIVAVLCDVSNSTTLIHSDNYKHKSKLAHLKKYIKEIPQTYYPGSSIYYYAINNNAVSEPLGGGAIKYNIVKTSHIKREVSRIDSLTNVIKKAIDWHAKETPSSCILSSIKRAVTQLKEYKRNHADGSYLYELIIISDMVEICQISTNEKVVMSLDNKTQMVQAIDKLVGVDLNINAMELNLKVKIIINSPNITGENERLIKDAWKKCLNKINILDDNIFFYSQDPEFAKQPVFSR